MELIIEQYLVWNSFGLYSSTRFEPTEAQSMGYGDIGMKRINYNLQP